MIANRSRWPAFTEEEAEAVAAVIRSNDVNYWTGQTGRSFEQAFARWAGTKHAVALANGTLAIDVALKALGIGPGHEVVVTPRTFIASVSAVVNAGATPIFADVDRNSGNLSPDTIAAVLTNRTRAILPVHLGGWPCDMEGIMNLAHDHRLKVIEDCAQAHGATVNGRCVGSIGHVGAWSFCQDKIITTGGEGGMVTTDDPELWSAMWSFKDHGKSWQAVYSRPHPPGFRFVHDSFGTNWRMLEMQAAIGLIQLNRIEKWHARRTSIATALAKALAKFPNAVRVPLPDNSLRHAFYRLYAYARPEGLLDGWTRDRIVETLTAAGIQVMHGTCAEVYLERAFDGTGLRPVERMVIARELGETSIAFLVHPTLTDEEVDDACSAISQILGEASR